MSAKKWVSAFRERKQGIVASAADGASAAAESAGTGAGKAGDADAAIASLSELVRQFSSSSLPSPSDACSPFREVESVMPTADLGAAGAAIGAAVDTADVQLEGV